MKFISSTFVLLLSLLCGPAAAEGMCPIGYYQTTPIGAGPIGCAPIPANSSSSAKWLDRWGAIASDSRGGWGISTEAPSKKQAITAALDDCRRRGGEGCEIRLEFRNQCAAVVADGSISITASDSTEKDAIKKATDSCKKNGSPEKCWTFYSGCSLPVRADG